MSYVDEASEQAPSVSLGTPTSTTNSQAQEIPVNPYSLLEAVNAASAAARGGWVIFLAIAAFILIAVAGVTHRDLLLNSKVDLPVLQVHIELTRFFLFAPMLLLFVHFGMLIQHVMLSRKTLEFDRSIRAMEVSRKPAHPLRLELHSYFFTQALAGPHRGWLLAGFLHAMVWISLVCLPVLIMLFTQVVFLPFHDQMITWAHRIVLTLDMLILVAVGVFLRRTEASFFSAFFRTMRRYPLGFLLTGTLFLAIFLLSFFVATIPGEPLDTLRPKPPVEQVEKEASRPIGFTKAATEFFSDSRDALKRGLDWMFSRNLVVTNVTDIVADDVGPNDDFTIVLRNRNLVNARLDGTDLHRVDFSGADLSGASLVDTDLRFASFRCGSPTQCTKLDDADLSGAKLDGATFELASLMRAKVVRASLPGAIFSASDLTAANFNRADLRRAKFTNEGNLYATEMPGANLRGAYLGGVNLHGANLSSADLEGAYMAWVNAFGADLSGARLDGAFMDGARLQGTNLDNASMLGTNLSNTMIWQSVPPNPLVFRLARTGGMKIAPPSKEDLDPLQDILDQIPENETSHLLARQRLANLLDTAEAKKWRGSIEETTWKQLEVFNAADRPDYFLKITKFLSLLACQERWSDGSVADGVISRALASDFKGDRAAIYSAITAKTCPAAKHISPDLSAALAGVIEEQGNTLESSLGSSGPEPAASQN